MQKNVKYSMQESGEAFRNVGKHTIHTADGILSTIGNTAKGLHHLINVGDLVINSKLGKSSNKILNFTKKNILKILIATSILTYSGAKIYENHKNKILNDTEISEIKDNKVDLKSFDYKIKTPDGLTGRKVGDLYSHYLGYNGKSSEILDTIVFKPNNILKELYGRKFRRENNKGFTVAKDFYENTVSKINFDIFELSSLELMTANIKISINKINKKFDRDKFGTEKLKGNEEKIKLFKNICSNIDEKCLLSYGMTELMPSPDGNLNKEILDFLLKNGGENFVMNLPAVADDYTSFGLYQFTSFAVFDTGERQEGASVMNLYLPEELQIPGSVTKLQGQDHHKAAYLFAMYNIYNLIFKADGETIKSLKLLINQKDNNDLAQLIAIMHNLPSSGKNFLTERYKLKTEEKYIKKKTYNKKGKKVYEYDINKNGKIDLYESLLKPKASHNYGKKTYHNRNTL